MRARLDANGKLEKRPGSPSARDGAVLTFSGGLGGQNTPDGFSVNTTQPLYQPSGIAPAVGGPLELADAKGTERLGLPLPPQTSKTIGDTLSAKGISWAWYAGGWNAALADGGKPLKRSEQSSTRVRTTPSISSRTISRSTISPGLRRARRIASCISRTARTSCATSMPAGCRRWCSTSPPGCFNQHPSYTDLLSGDAHIADILERLRRGPQWSRMVVIVTYDENGGFWDHVPPPTGSGWGDRWGPATRIPALIISPFAKRGLHRQARPTIPPRSSS